MCTFLQLAARSSSCKGGMITVHIHMHHTLLATAGRGSSALEHFLVLAEGDQTIFLRLSCFSHAILPLPPLLLARCGMITLLSHQVGKHIQGYNLIRIIVPPFLLESLPLCIGHKAGKHTGQATSQTRFGLQ